MPFTSITTFTKLESIDEASACAVVKWFSASCVHEPDMVNKDVWPAAISTGCLNCTLPSGKLCSLQMTPAENWFRVKIMFSGFVKLTVNVKVRDILSGFFRTQTLFERISSLVNLKSSGDR